MTISSSSSSSPAASLSTENKDAYHWLGLAISLAYSLGLNRTSHPTTTLRKKRLERRIWWSAFIRDRTLALSPAGTFARPVRIRTEDCDVKMLCLADFDLSSEMEEDGDGIRVRVEAEKCIEKAMVCWCSNNGSVSHFGVLNALPQSQPPQHITIPEPLMGHEEQIYTSTSFSTAPIFDEDSYSSPSLLEDCPTPRVFHEPVSIMQEEKMGTDSPLGGGFGVDGEYDDYMEYLKDTPDVKVKQDRERSTWAFQLDCENDCVVEV
jgi:hypothetical protein